MEKTIGDLMTPIYDYPKLLVTHTLEDVITALTAHTHPEKNLRPLVIVYENNLPVGLVSLPEILKVIEAEGFLQEKTCRGWRIETWLLPVFWTGLFTKKCFEAYHKPIKDFMQPITYQINTSDPLQKALYYMTRGNLEAMIVKEGERFAGIIHRHEIFSAIAGLIKARSSAGHHVPVAS